MTARYYVLVSREMLDVKPPWEQAGLRLIAWGGLDGNPGWCLFEDDNAPPELAGRRVRLTLTQTENGLQLDREAVS